MPLRDGSGGDRVEARRQPISERDEPQLAQVEEPGVMRASTELLETLWRAVDGPDVENRRGPMTADDPNGRMKAARDAMNKTVVSQFDIRSS